MSDTINSSLTGSSDANVTIFPITSPSPATTTQGKENDTQGVSTISKSTKEHILDPGVVWIPPPLLSFSDYGLFLANGTPGIDSSSPSNLNSLAVSQICLSIASNWAKGEDKIAQGNQDEINSTSYQIKADYQHRLAVGDPAAAVGTAWNTNQQVIAERTKEDYKSAFHRMIVDFQHSLDKKDPTAVNEAAVVTAVFMIAAATTFAVAGTEMVSNASNIGFNIIQDAVNPVLPLMPGDMRAELGLLGTLMMTTLVAQTTLITIASGGTGKGKNIDMEFAKNFAKILLAKLANGSIEREVYSKIISKLPQGSELTDPQREQINAKVKLMLLFNALALINKVEMGHLTAEELADMINPNGLIKLKEGDPRIELIKYIRDNLALLPPSERASLLEKLFEYYDGQPSLENLADQSKAYAAIFEEAGRADNVKVVQQHA